MPPQRTLTLQPPDTSAAQPILRTQSYQNRLDGLQHSFGQLVQAGYRLSQFSQQELIAKKRCVNCTKVFKPPKDEGSFTEQHSKYGFGGQAPPALLQSSRAEEMTGNAPQQYPQSGQQKAVCVYHPGQWNHQSQGLSCCNQKSNTPGCYASSHHHEPEFRHGELENFWRLYPTQHTQNNSIHRSVVAIDCEMGTMLSGDTYLIRVSLVDYFSGFVLVDNLVLPDVPMAHYNTRYSGVTRRDIELARRAGSGIMGRDRARMLCQRFVGPNTIIVGHAAQNDLLSLRWMHPQVVDTYLIESSRIKKEEGSAAAEAEKEVVELDGEDEIDPNSISGPSQSSARTSQAKPKRKVKGTGRLALKTLTKERLGRDIQMKDRLGHDSLEDAVAARDLVDWYVRHADNQGSSSDYSSQVQTFASHNVVIPHYEDIVPTTATTIGTYREP